MAKNKKNISTMNYELYEEIGSYFDSKGNLDKKVFTTTLKKYIKEIKKNSSSEKTFNNAYRNWLSDYIQHITDYLNDKGVNQGTIELLKMTVETSLEEGVDSMLIPSSTFQTILNNFSVPGRKKKPDSKKNTIFEAALKVFAEEGFYAATIDRIASISKIGKGTVYTFFKSKEELFEQLLKEEYDKIIEGIGSSFESSENVLIGIQKMIEFWITYINDNPMVYRLIKIDQGMQFLSTSHTTYYQYITEKLPLFKARVIALNKEERLKSTDLYSTFYGIMGYIEGVAQKWIYKEMSYPLTDEIPVILETIFNGFVGESTTRRKYFNPEKK